MGGYGSGKRVGSRQRPIKGESLRVSSTYLHQEDLIQRGQEFEKSSTLTYTSNRRKGKSTIGITTLPNEIQIDYTITDKRSGDKQEFSYSVTVEWTECNFGGYRPWFRCPSANCNERVEKLYKPPNENYFACRHCHDISYHRCNISGKPTDIAMYKKRRLADKLDEDEPDVRVGLTPPNKPKDMHWETYNDLYDEWKYWDKRHELFCRKKLEEFQEKYRFKDLT